MLYPEGLDLDLVKRCRKRKENPEGIPIPLNSLRTDPSDMRQVLIEKMMDQGREFHTLAFCQREKSTSALRLIASATRR